MPTYSFINDDTGTLKIKLCHGMQEKNISKIIRS